LTLAFFPFPFPPLWERDGVRGIEGRWGKPMIIRIPRGLIILPLVTFLLACSCALLKVAPEGRFVKDHFSRTYPVDFAAFHPKINLALQDYAKSHKGNSFQVLRLGSDGVIIRGLYKGERDPERISTTITAKPVPPKNTRVEIKFFLNNMPGSSDSLERAAIDLFRLIEERAATRPLE